MSLARFASRRGIPLEVVLEVFEERAAIRQFVGGMPQARAEHEAVRDTVEALERSADDAPGTA